MRLRRAYCATLQHLSKGYKGIKGARKSITWAQTQLTAAVASRGYDAGRLGKHSIQPELNMKMIAPSPPRAVRILSVADAFSELSRMLRDLDALALRISLVTELDQLHRFVSSYTASSPAPGVVPRSFLRMLLSPDHRGDQIAGGLPMTAWIKASMTQYLIPDEALARPEAGVFVQRCAKVVFNYCLTLTYNAGRQRRRMVHAMEDWGQVQIQAERMDQHAFLVHDENGKGSLVSATGAFFSGWLLDHLILMVTRYLELGFQLRLYAGFEYSMIYWYWDYLLGVRINCQPTLFFPTSRAFQEQQLKKDKAAAAAKSNKKKGKADKGGDKVKKAPEASLEHLSLEAHQALCRGMFRLVAGLTRQGTYFIDPLSAASLPLRFHRRFSPVMRLEQPSALTYDHYLDSTDCSPYMPSDLFAASGESFAEAKAVCERLAHRLRDKTLGASPPELASLDEDQLESVRGLLRVAGYNHSLSVMLQTRAILLAQHPTLDPAQLPPLPTLPDVPKKETGTVLVPPLEGGEPSTLGTVLPCDAPRVTMSPYIAFDFTGCASFPCVVVTT